MGGKRRVNASRADRGVVDGKGVEAELGSFCTLIPRHTASREFVLNQTTGSIE